MADQISGGGIGFDKCLEELVTTTMRGIDNTEEWKLKVRIFWERINERFKIKYQTYKQQVQSKKRHHLHLENSHDLFPNSDRYKGMRWQPITIYSFGGAYLNVMRKEKR